MTKFVFLLIASSAFAQVVTKNPQSPDTPASLTVFAQDGDLTYCVGVAVKGTKPAMQLSCRKSGITHLTTSFIDSDSFISVGDQVWSFQFNWEKNPQKMYFSVATNVRDTTKAWLLLNTSTLTGEFQVGEMVADSTGSKRGSVKTWGHFDGTTRMNGAVSTSATANLILIIDAGGFVVGDQLVGQTTGTKATVSEISPITSNIVKSAGFIDWPTPTPSNVLVQVWNSTLGKVIK